MMEPQYNAFISYRHHPEDIAAATQIHRLLERFRVPKALRGKTRGITRLFRDKDELPITANLSEDITSALKNSEFLIVICSVHTRESQWVQREIDTFLQTHDRSRVLTVLVNGEPYDVIPESLLYEEQTDPVTGAVTRVDLEPLSCDWRLGLRRAKREELPRLAAALLHCSYDELRQRQKQYRMQQLLIGGSVALAASLGLAAYFLYTSITIRNANLQIQENYNRALENQSEYLATAASGRADAGERMTALALLLEALPGEGNERPYVPEAEAVLSETLGIYDVSEGLLAKGVMRPEESTVVTAFKTTLDGERIYILDQRNLVTVWDTASLVCTAALETDLEIQELVEVTKEGKALLLGYDGKQSRYALQCYRPDGQLQWQLPDAQEVALLGQREALLVITRSGQQESLHFLDQETGAPIREPVTLSTEGTEYHQFLEERYVPGGPMTMTRKTDAYESYLLNPDTGETHPLLVSKYRPYGAAMTTEGNVVVMVSGDSGVDNGRYLNMVITSPAIQDIFCFDGETGAQLWQSQLTTYQYTACQTVKAVPSCNAILCQAGNTLQLVQETDGTVFSRCEANGGIVQVAQVSDGSAFCVQRDGGLCTYRFSTGDCQTIYYDVAADITYAEVNYGLYTLCAQDTKVTYYETKEPEYTWQTPVPGMEYRQDFCLAGDRVAFTCYHAIGVFDLNRREALWQENCEYTPKLLGVSQGRIWATELQATVTAYDLETGARQTWELPEQVGDRYVYIESDLFLGDGEICYLATDAEELYVMAFAPETGMLRSQSLGDLLGGVPEMARGWFSSTGALETWLNSGDSREFQDLREQWLELAELQQQRNGQAQVLLAAQDCLWVYTGDGCLWRVPRDGEPMQAARELPYPPPVALGPEGTLAVGAGTQVLMLAPDGSVKQTLSLGEEQAGSLYYLGEELLVLTDQAGVLRFDALGSQRNRRELRMVSTSFSAQILNPDGGRVVWTPAPDGKLVINAFGMANVLERNHWQFVAYADCTVYDPLRDQFLGGWDGCWMGMQRRTLPELLEIAKQQLGSYTLPEDVKQAYGVDER